MPAYTLEGYRLAWTVAAPDGQKVFAQGVTALPTLPPGTTWSGPFSGPRSKRTIGSPSGSAARRGSPPSNTPMMRTVSGGEMAWIDSCTVAFCCWEAGRCGRHTHQQAKWWEVCAALRLIEIWQG